MSKRGSDFLYHRISDRLPDNPIVDPVLLVIDMAVDAMGGGNPRHSGAGSMKKLA